MQYLEQIFKMGVLPKQALRVGENSVGEIAYKRWKQAAGCVIRRSFETYGKV